MNSMQRADLFLKDLKHFVSFLRNLWGIFAVLSILFPIINVLIKIIPLHSFTESGVLVWFSPELFTTIAVLLSISTILAMYNSRSNFVKQANLDRLHNLSLKSFGIGVTVLLIYLALYFFLRSNSPAEFLSNSVDIRRLLLESLLLCLYSGSFAMITRGFALLATGEFFNR
jgi:hypothetical protein